MEYRKRRRWLIQNFLSTHYTFETFWYRDIGDFSDFLSQFHLNSTQCHLTSSLHESREWNKTKERHLDSSRGTLGTLGGGWKRSRRKNRANRILSPSKKGIRCNPLDTGSANTWSGSRNSRITKSLSTDTDGEDPPLFNLETPRLFLHHPFELLFFEFTRVFAVVFDRSRFTFCVERLINLMALGHL